MVKTQQTLFWFPDIELSNTCQNMRTENGIVMALRTLTKVDEKDNVKKSHEFMAFKF